MAQLSRTYSGNCSVSAHVETVLQQFEDYAEEHLRDWHPSGSVTATSEFTVQLKQKFNIGVDLKPASVMSWLEDAFKRDRHRKRNGWYDPYIRERPVRFDYKVRLRFLAAGIRQTEISYETIEEVDPDRNIPRKLGDEFKVPSMPEEKGNVGERILDALRSVI
jgi:hypothetical protein